MKNDKDKSADAAELRRRAETRLRESKKGEAARPGTKEETQRLLHELQVHQVELEMQNEELRQAQAEMEAGLERYTDLHNFTPVGCFTLDRDGAISQVNPTGASLLGIERSRLVNRRFGLFVSDESRPAFNAFLKKVFENQAKETCETALRTDGNEPVWVHIEANASEDGQGCRAAVVDITERKRAEEALRESEERYKSLFECVPAGLYRTTPEGQVIDANPALVCMLGYPSREAMMTLNVADEYGDEKERKRWQTLIEREGVVRGFETRWRRFDGTLIWVHESAKAIRDNEGRIMHYEGVVEDITEHKQADEALRKSETNLKEAQALGRMGNWEFDFDKQTVQWSDQVYKLYERDPALGPPTVEEEAAYYSPEQAERLHEYTRIAAELGRAFEYDLEARLPSGRIAHFSATMRPFKDGSGRIVKLFGTVQDITERKRAEEQLQKSLQQTKKVLEEVVWALSSIVERRDPYTAGHQRGVAELACALAGELNLPEVQIEGIRVAGIIHDIGKMNVPAEILSKTGRLSEAEFNIIKTHSQIGKEVLEPIDFPWPIAQVVHQHHERLNGTGYPQGLSAEKIILEAKIMAVADVVEAMASHRPYRPALGIEKALEEISSQSSILYDPQVVDACRELFDKKGYKLA